MTDRTVELEAALRANYALIVEAQEEVERYLTKQFEAAELVNRLIRVLDGEKQREAQRVAREALGEDFGNNA
jgi:DNA-binding response OmpR family regulator